MKYVCPGFLVVLSAPNVLALTDSELAIKSRGIILYNQYKASTAIPSLITAAKAGDHEAQYYLAEALRKKNHYMNAEARKWYEASADQNDLYAMTKMTPEQIEAAKKFAQEWASSHPPLSFFPDKLSR
ncbi:hypothetical protein ACIP66_07975 [Pseudomonas sp. NPDC088429]|jgi:hypothetical protein|uniref:hypothetical protein n=1 Tax=Pseudomonas sp. NPDC088429 TaxID=3364455 RepID=UPI003812AA70